MPEKNIKVPTLSRELKVADFQLRKGEQATDPYRMSFSASSEMPIERWFGNEVLSHSADAVKLDRMKAGAMPLLFNHDFNDPIGMIDSGRVENGRLMVDAHLFATDRAEQIRSMVEGGLRNVSIGYRLNVIEENTKTDTFTATDWEPYEISIVTVPADPSVGIGRAAQEFEVRMISSAVPQKPAQARSFTMPEKANDPGENADKQVSVSAVQAERERREAIIALCKSNKIDSRIEGRWIEEGTPLTKVAGEILDVMEERGKQRPLAASELGLNGKEARGYSLFRAVRALRFGGQNRKLVEDAAFEMECSASLGKRLNRELSSSILVPAEVLKRPLGEAAKRAMSTVPGQKGGFMVDVENMGFIDILRNRSVAMKMGCRILSGLQGNVTIPRQTGKATVTWQAGENATTTATDQAIGQLSMTPRVAIAITDVSEQLLIQATPSAEAFVMADLANDVAIDGVDNAVINGTGGAMPLGIKNVTGITSGQDASSATYAKILAFPQTAGTANAIRGNPGWVTNTAGAARLMQVQRFTSTDTPLWSGNMMDGTLVGFNAMSSEQLASGNLIFGSWDEVVIGEWGVLEIATDSGGTRFNALQVGIRAMWMCDVLVRYPQAFVVGTNLS